MIKGSKPISAINSRIQTFVALSLFLPITLSPYSCLAADTNNKTIASISNNFPLTKLEPKLATPDNTSSSQLQSAPLPGQSTSNTSQNNSAGNAPPPAPDRQVPAASGTENYPTIGKMEVVTFGGTRPNWSVTQRLTALEQAVFKTSFNNMSLFDRTQRLQAAILGAASEPAGGDGASSMDETYLTPSVEQTVAQTSYFDDIITNPENQTEISQTELQAFALQLVNYARSQMRVSALNQDAIAVKMAEEHAEDLSKRNLVSHSNKAGKNPDLRYTICGGVDAVLESLVSLKREQLKTHRLSKSMVAQAFKTLMSRQDDRDAFLSSDATGFGFAIKWMNNGERIIACSEISNSHGTLEPISTLPISVGDKVEVTGSIAPPYKFSRISLAWEGAHEDTPEATDETEEALPYFPPLDYIAYSSKAEHDYEKAMTALRMAGIVAAIAGGMFIPPVALAAPLIAASGSMSEPKPMSDIPVRGGIKSDQQTFSGRIPFNNEGKEGIYYLTVWASNDKNDKLVPISRRAYIVKAGAGSHTVSESEDVEGTVVSQPKLKSKPKSKSKKHKHKKQKLDTRQDLKQ